MIVDVLAKNIFKRIKEPALILNIRKGEVIISAINQAYINLLPLPEEHLLGKPFFSTIIVGDPHDLRSIKESLDLLTNENLEEQTVLKKCFFKNPCQGYEVSAVQIHSALLSEDKIAGKYILQTLNFLSVPIPKHIPKQLLTESSIISGYANPTILQLVYEEAQEPIVLLDKQLRIVFCTKKFQTLHREYYGTAIEVGSSIIDYVEEGRKELLIERYNRVLEGNREHSEIIAEVSANVFKKLVLDFKPVIGKFGDVEHIIVSAKDITLQRQAEQKLEENERELRFIYDNLHDAVFVIGVSTGPNFKFISANNSFLELFEISSELVLDAPIDQVISKIHLKSTIAHYNECVNSGLAVSWEEELSCDLGNKIVIVNLTPVFDLVGVCEKLIGSIHDISERKELERTGEATHRKLARILESSPDVICTLDKIGNFLSINEACERMWGYSPEDCLGKDMFGFLHPDDKDGAEKGFSKLQTQQKIELAPFRFLHRDGSWVWVETVLNDLTSDFAVNGIVTNFRNVTEKINAQRETTLSNERYKFVSMATSDAIWDWNLETNNIFWEDSFERIFHWQPSRIDFDLKTWSNLVHPEDRTRVEEKLLLFLESSENQWSDEYRFSIEGGKFAVVSDRGIVVRDEAGKAVRVVGAMQDITSQRNKDHQLKLLESVVTQTSEMVMVTQADPFKGNGQRIIYVNEAFCRITGYNSEELIGETPRILHGKNTNKKEIIKLRKALQRVESCEICVVNYKKDGSEFWNNFTINPLTDDKGDLTHYISVGRNLSNSINLQKQEHLMSSISQIFNTTDGLFEAMEQTMKLLARWEKYSYSEIWMLDHDGLHLGLLGKHSSTLDSDENRVYFNQTKKVVKSQGFPGEVWEVGKILCRINSEDNLDCFMERGLSNAPVKSLYGIPLIYNNELIGVLVVGAQDLEMQKEFGMLAQKFSAHLAAEIQRKQLEEELGQIFAFVPDIIAIADFDGYFKKLNPAASGLLGYTTNELMSKPYVEFLHPEDKKKALWRIRNIGVGNSTDLVEERYLTKKGDIKWLSWTSHVEVERRLIFSVAKEITEKKNLEELLARSNSLAKVGSWEINVLTNSVYWSDVTKEIREVDLSFEPDLETGMGHFRNDIDKETIKKKVQECISFGLPWDEELEILTFKGNPKWIRTKGQAEMLEGKCIRIFGSFQDVDIRKRAEIDAKLALIKLEESEKRYSDLFHLSPNPMWVYNCDTLQFMDVNETAILHYGYSYEEFMNMTLYNIRSETEIPALKELVRTNEKEGCKSYLGGVKHQKKNGETIDVEIKSNVVRFKGQRAAIVLINDITERQKDFNTLQKQNEILKEISWVQSHVVRAPLSKLMGLVDLLGKNSMKDEDKQQILVKNIEHCTAELDEIIRTITKKSEQQVRLSKF